jgi:hypothetical protein
MNKKVPNYIMSVSRISVQYRLLCNGRLMRICRHCAM